MEAVVLAGGLGTRLREVASDRAKPMATVAGRPFLEWIVLAPSARSRPSRNPGSLFSEVWSELGKVLGDKSDRLGICEC